MERAWRARSGIPVVFALCGCSLAHEGDSARVQAETRAICQSAIRSQLDAPATASFAAIGESVVGPAAESRDIMRMLTFVNARDAASGPLRRYFQCDCELTNGRWALRQLKEIKRGP